MKIKILSNFAHLDLGMCKFNEVKDVKTSLAKKLIDAKLAEKVTNKKVLE